MTHNDDRVRAGCTVARKQAACEAEGGGCDDADQNNPHERNRLWDQNDQNVTTVSILMTHPLRFFGQRSRERGHADGVVPADHP